MTASSIDANSAQSGQLSAKRLMVNRLPHSTCGVCGRHIVIGEVVSWDSFVAKGSKVRCVENNGCWASKFDPADVQAKKSGKVATPVTTIDVNPVPASQDLPLADVETPASSPVPSARNGESSAFGVLADAIAPYMEARLKTKVDAAQVRDIVRDVVEETLNLVSPPIRIQSVNGEIKDIGIQHEKFPLLLKCCSARTPDGHHLNIMLKGPAGSGKTTAAKCVATALDLKFFFCGAISEPFALLGFTDASGKTVRTPFREAWEHGGIFLFDEFDGSDPNAVLPFNAALANGSCAFPDGIIERHQDCVIIAATNTWGLGATDAYVGRLKLDGASLDRFVVIVWDVDTKLEKAYASNKAWTAKVQKVRSNVVRNGIRVLVTPRASIYGSALLDAGIDEATVEAMVLRKAMSDEQWNTVKVQ